MPSGKLPCALTVGLVADRPGGTGAEQLACLLGDELEHLLGLHAAGHDGGHAAQRRLFLGEPLKPLVGRFLHLLLSRDGTHKGEPKGSAPSLQPRG